MTTPRVVSPTAVAVALDLAERHGLSVFPCWHRDHAVNAKGEPTGRKSPHTARGFKDASRDPEKIRAWWRQWPDALIGVATGPVSDLYVIDVDPGGLPFYEQRIADFNARRMHKTERGWHLLYRDAGLGCSASTLSRGIDTRGEGGYVIWWPATGLAATGELEERGALPAWVCSRLTSASTKERISAPIAAAPLTPGKDRSRDLLRLVAADVTSGLTDHQILETRRGHEHAQDQRDPDRAVRRCIEKVREDQQKKQAHLETALNDFRASVIADLAAGPEAVDAAEAPTFIVEGILPACGANLAGTGGASKTTTTISEGIAICLGSRLYGREIIKQRPCVIVTAEDGARYGRYLLQRALTDGIGLGKISERGATMAKAGVRFVSWPRARFGPIALVDRYGNLERAPNFDALLELLAPIDPALVSLDPLALLGPGERFGNDADAFVAAMAHEAAQALGACVQFVDHVSQAVARGGIVDQHAARGGSAKTDNARLARQLVRVESLDGMALPPDATPEDLTERRLLALHTTKLNYAPRPPVQHLRRTGYWIEALRSLRPEEAEALRASETRRLRDAEAVAVLAAVSDALTRGEYPNASSIGDWAIEADGSEMARKAIRNAIGACRRDGRLVELPLPAAHRRGARKTYLAVREAPRP